MKTEQKKLNYINKEFNTNFSIIDSCKAKFKI